MLDLMEMRGFRISESLHMPEHRETALMLYTPDGYGYAVMEMPPHSLIVCAFSVFESLTTQYP